jgi:hypothetical protein
MIYKKIIPKKIHMMLALMLDPRFKDLSILNSYMGIEKSTIITIMTRP